MSINEKLRSVIDLTTRVKKETNLRVFVAYFCGTFIGACLIISAWREYRQVQTCQYAALLQAEIGQITDLTSLLPLTAETAEFLPELMVNSLRDTREDLHKELFFQVFRSSKLPKDYLAQWGRFKSTLQELSSCHSWLDSQFAPPIINSESFVRLEKKQKTLKAVWGTALLENQKKAIQLSEEIERDRKLLCSTKKNHGSSLTLEALMKDKCQSTKYQCQDYMDKIESQTRNLASVQETNTHKFEKKWGSHHTSTLTCD